MSMFGGNASPSLADIAAVTERNSNGGFGGDMGAWWVLIILFALFGGWGNNGFNGNRGGDSSGTTIVTVPTGGGYEMGYGRTGNGFISAEIQNGFNNQAVISKLDGINGGICSLGYDQLAQMNGINTNVMQTGFGLQQAINNNTVANMQNTNALSTQMADCCCENRQGQADIKYAMATDTCAITTAIERASDRIVQNDNQNYRQLHDEMVEMQMQAKDAKIAEQAQVINALNLAASQQAQNRELVAELRPTPQPAYIACNPFTGSIFPNGTNGFNGWNNNCCCA